MRVFLGILGLLSLFALAAAWQERHTQALEREHARLTGAGSGAAPAPHASEGDPDLAGAWTTLVIGRPSGQLPIAPSPEREPRAVLQPVRRQSTRRDSLEPGHLPGGFVSRPAATQASAPRPGGDPAEFVYSVKSGDVLSVICSDYYGSRRGPFANLAQLVDAVAAYNDLASPDALRAGKTIRLPALPE